MDYISAFNDLSIKIPDMTEPEAFRLFMRGLKPEIRNEMEKRYITEGLPRLQREAHAYDSLIQSQRYGQFNRPRNDSSPKKPFDRKSFHQIQADSRPPIECFNCGKKGHMRKDCRSGQKPKWNLFKKSDKNLRSHTTYKEATKHLKKITKENRDKEEPTKELNVIAFQRSDDKVIIPTQGTPGSAGYDLTPCESGIIKPRQQAIINTGVHIAIPRNHVGLIRTRSSAAILGLS